MAIGVAVRCEDDGSAAIETVLDQGDFDVVWAKTNIGLGRPDPAQVEAKTMQEAHS